MKEYVVKLEHVNKQFKDTKVLKDINLSIEQGEFILIKGVSGCGKSTLLNLIGLLDKPTSGDIIWYGKKNIKPFSKQAEVLLRDHIGYLFQNYALIDAQDVAYNLSLVFHQKITKEEKQQRIKDALARVHLEGYEGKKVYKCSGGEQQRIALARLYLKSCDLILADEPTGSLDTKNKEDVMQCIQQFHKEGKTILMVTHDESLRSYADRVIELEKVS